MKQTECYCNPAITADLKAGCVHEPLVMGVGNEFIGSQALKEFAVCKEHRNPLIALHRVNRASVLGESVCPHPLDLHLPHLSMCLWFLICNYKSLPRDRLCLVLTSGNYLLFRKHPVYRNLLKSNVYSTPPTGQIFLLRLQDKDEENRKSRALSSAVP